MANGHRGRDNGSAASTEGGAAKFAWCDQLNVSEYYDMQVSVHMHTISSIHTHAYWYP